METVPEDSWWLPGPSQENEICFLNSFIEISQKAFPCAKIQCA